MRVCPAGSPVKAHAPVPTVRFLTSGFGRRPERNIGVANGNAGTPPRKGGSKT